MRWSLPVFSSALICSAALAAGCGAASPVPRPTSSDARWAAEQWPEVDREELADGRSLYVRKCGGCHSLYTPAEVVRRDWPAQFIEMSETAHLTPDEQRRIERYLVSVTRDGRPL